MRQKLCDPAEINKNKQAIVGIEQPGNEFAGWVLTGRGRDLDKIFIEIKHFHYAVDEYAYDKILYVYHNNTLTGR